MQEGGYIPPPLQVHAFELFGLPSHSTRMSFKFIPFYTYPTMVLPAFLKVCPPRSSVWDRNRYQKKEKEKRKKKRKDSIIHIFKHFLFQHRRSRSHYHDLIYTRYSFEYSAFCSLRSFVLMKYTAYVFARGILQSIFFVP